MSLENPLPSATSSVDVSRNYTAPAKPSAGATATPTAPAAPSADARPPTLPGPTPPSLAAAPQNIGAAVPSEYLGDLPVHLAVDLGSQPHATGTVTTDANGTPTSYTVAADDDSVAVSHRFALDQYMLGYLNCVRRMDDQYFIGDTLNLDAETITTVGDENGVSYAFADRLPNPHPQQH
ncbi:MAG: hypothetical protein JWQ19_53 [Subtercola sp.]|nr:hypothetical protein [Subtercola sp.]